MDETFSSSSSNGSDIDRVPDNKDWVPDKEDSGYRAGNNLVPGNKGLSSRDKNRSSRKDWTPRCSTNEADKYQDIHETEGGCLSEPKQVKQE